MTAHVTVMRQEVIDALALRPGQCIVDATLGLGGHSESLLQQMDPSSRVIGLDRDRGMLERAQARLQHFGARFQASHSRLSELAKTLERLGVSSVDGVVMDLGLCSAQLDDPERGFSFADSNAHAALDMRMDTSQGMTAAELLDTIDEDALVQILWDGDVPHARRVARALLDARPIPTCGALLDAIKSVRLPLRKHHPATLIFQALRVAVNQEFDELEQALRAAVDVLHSGGRLAVLSYHSGEDRRVKQLFQEEARGCICPPDLPRCGCGRVPRLKLVRRGDGPDANEILLNPRARSARLRVAEKW